MLDRISGGGRSNNICNTEPRCERCYDNVNNVDKDYFCRSENTKRVERRHPGCECDKRGGKFFKCIDEIWGEHCNNTSPLHCAESSCGRYSGTCKGCRKGNWGELCNIHCESVDNCEHVNTSILTVPKN